MMQTFTIFQGKEKTNGLQIQGQFSAIFIAIYFLMHIYVLIPLKIVNFV